MTKILPKDLTSYDFLKALAVLLMIVDHIGYHFYPEDMWFRVLGRLCVPIWFFLIGYADTTRIPRKWWVGALLVFVSSLVAGQFLLPLNILFTIIVARYVRHGLVIRALHSPEGLRGIFLILFFASFPLALVFEYGTVVFLFVVLGYMVRHSEEAERQIGARYIRFYTFAAFFVFFMLQGFAMPSVSGVQAVVMLAGFVAIGWWLWTFRPAVYPDLTKKLPHIFVLPLQLLGRRTLEIYVAHLIILRAIAMVVAPERFEFWQWSVMPGGMLAMFM